MASPTGKQKVSSASALCVSNRAQRQGKKRPKSGTMLPMTTAESRRQRASRRANGKTAAGWDKVNGIKSSACHLIAILQNYKSELLTPRPTSSHGHPTHNQRSRPVASPLARPPGRTESLVQRSRRRHRRRRHHICWYHLANDLSVVRDTRAYPFVLLGIALFIALGFEFVNGFHDTANAVATVIYTHSMPPNFAVVWSGAFNFLGVLLSSGAVAFGIVSLLPVELILQVGSGAGFAMVFALLIAAIIWNLGTWYFGLPSSSSHTLIGSIMGVGLMNQLMAASGSGTSGVDWGQATKIGESLLFSPLIGFSLSALAAAIAKALIPIPALYKEPEGNQPPPAWIRGLLVLTCTGVSFAHGSNDGQKGMGLIMLILIGTVPTAYALEPHHARSKMSINFVAISRRRRQHWRTTRRAQRRPIRRLRRSTSCALDRSARNAAGTRRAVRLDRHSM